MRAFDDPFDLGTVAADLAAHEVSLDKLTGDIEIIEAQLSGGENIGPTGQPMLPGAYQEWKRKALFVAAAKRIEKRALCRALEQARDGLAGDPAAPMPPHLVAVGVKKARESMRELAVLMRRLELSGLVLGDHALFGDVAELAVDLDANLAAWLGEQAEVA
jgi:hypothetical protein